MTRAYNVVDANGHILEPVDLWDTFIDPEFRERRPNEALPYRNVTSPSSIRTATSAFPET